MLAMQNVGHAFSENPVQALNILGTNKQQIPTITKIEKKKSSHSISQVQTPYEASTIQNM